MAEERFIDDDKDRKFRIRKNADGEDELILDDSAEETEEVKDGYEFVESDTDDEEAAVLTPEQLAERRRIKEEEERIKAEKLAAAIGEVRLKIEQGDFESAIFRTKEAQEAFENNGELACLKLLSESRNLTDFSALDKCCEAAAEVKDYASAEEIEPLKGMCGQLKVQIEKLTSERDETERINEEKKAERRAVFAADRARSVKFFLATAIPFTAALVLAIAFATLIFTDLSGSYLVATIVCAAVAGVFLLLSFITARKLWGSQRNVFQNEKDDKTELGRKYLELKEHVEKLNGIYAAINGEI